MTRSGKLVSHDLRVSQLVSTYELDADLMSAEGAPSKSLRDRMPIKTSLTKGSGSCATSGVAPPPGKAQRPRRGLRGNLKRHGLVPCACLNWCDCLPNSSHTYL